MNLQDNPDSFNNLYNRAKNIITTNLDYIESEISESEELVVQIENHLKAIKNTITEKNKVLDIHRKDYEAIFNETYVEYQKKIEEKSKTIMNSIKKQKNLSDEKSVVYLKCINNSLTDIIKNPKLSSKDIVSEVKSIANRCIVAKIEDSISSTILEKEDIVNNLKDNFINHPNITKCMIKLVLKNNNIIIDSNILEKYKCNYDSIAGGVKLCSQNMIQNNLDAIKIKDTIDTQKEVLQKLDDTIKEKEQGFESKVYTNIEEHLQDLNNEINQKDTELKKISADSEKISADSEKILDYYKPIIDNTNNNNNNNTTIINEYYIPLSWKDKKFIYDSDNKNNTTDFINNSDVILDTSTKYSDVNVHYGGDINSLCNSQNNDKAESLKKLTNNIKNKLHYSKDIKNKQSIKDKLERKIELIEKITYFKNINNQPCVELNTPCPSYLGLATNKTIDDFITTTDKIWNDTETDEFVKKITPRNNSLTFLKKRISDDEYVKMFGQWLEEKEHRLWYIHDTMSSRHLGRTAVEDVIPDKYKGNDHKRLHTRNKTLYLSYLKWQKTYKLQERHINTIKNKLKFIDERDNNLPDYTPKFSDVVFDDIIPQNINVYELRQFSNTINTIQKLETNGYFKWNYISEGVSGADGGEFLLEFVDHNVFSDDRRQEHKNQKNGVKYRNWIIKQELKDIPLIYRTYETVKNFYLLDERGVPWFFNPDAKIGINQRSCTYFTDDFELQRYYPDPNGTKGQDMPGPATYHGFYLSGISLSYLQVRYRGVGVGLPVFKATKDGRINENTPPYFKGLYYVFLESLTAESSTRPFSEYLYKKKNIPNDELILFEVERFNNYYGGNAYNLKILMRNNITVPDQNIPAGWRPKWSNSILPLRPYYTLDMLIMDTKEGKAFNERIKAPQDTDDYRFYLNKHAYNTLKDTDLNGAINKYTLDLGCHIIQNIGYNKLEKRDVDRSKKLCLFVIHNLLVMATLVEDYGKPIKYKNHNTQTQITNIYWKAVPPTAEKAAPQIILDIIDVLSESENNPTIDDQRQNPNSQSGGYNSNKSNSIDERYILSEKDKTVNDKILRNEKLKKSYDHIENIINNSNNKELIVKQVLNTFKIINNNNKNTLKVLSKNIREKNR